jgi:hypothetical protein
VSIRKAFQVILAALLLTIFGQTLYAQNNGRWIYLGESNVDGNTDHDKIKIGRDDGRFRAIQIRVELGGARPGYASLPACSLG